jgi:FKBP-type peptidyl-prolyl cis-trans isomerase
VTMFRSLLLAPIAATMLVSAARAETPALTEGLRIEDIEVGTGDEARKGKTVTVHYTGWLYSQPDEARGKKVDSSHGGKPFTFRLGAGEAIKGWDEGVPGMKAGGVRELIIPPKAGYGNRRSGPVPANSWLIFEIELIEVK